MLKRTFIAVILITALSCKKKTYCWVCHENSTGNDIPEMCGKTDKDIKNFESQGYSCYKQ